MADTTIHFTAEVLARTAQERMKALEEEAATLQARLDTISEEHGKLYAMALAYEGDHSKEVINQYAQERGDF